MTKSFAHLKIWGGVWIATLLLAGCNPGPSDAEIRAAIAAATQAAQQTAAVESRKLTQAAVTPTPTASPTPVPNKPEFTSTSELISSWMGGTQFNQRFEEEGAGIYEALWTGGMHAFLKVENGTTVTSIFLAEPIGLDADPFRKLELKSKVFSTFASQEALDWVTSIGSINPQEVISREFYTPFGPAILTIHFVPENQALFYYIDYQ